MRPIDYRVDATFMQALRCVEFRIPHGGRFKQRGYVHALALRYGLIGVAATHHLFLSCQANEQCEVVEMIDGWSGLVDEHVRLDLADRVAFPQSCSSAREIGRLAREPLFDYLPLYHRLYPLEIALMKTAEDFLERHRQEEWAGWSIFKRRQAVTAFRACAIESVTFARNFFERRQLGLQELPEIALLGE